MKLTALQIDPDRVETGEWVSDLPDAGDLRIKTRGLNCAAFQRLQAAKLRALPRAARRNGQIDPQIMRQISVECVAEACLQGWENLEDESGPILFSREKARELAQDKRFQPLHDAWVAAAAQVGDNRADDVDATVGNSSAA
jgi:hypothetical protein